MCVCVFFFFFCEFRFCHLQQLDHLLVKASTGRAVMGKASSMSKKKTRASQVSPFKHKHTLLFHLQMDFNLQPA